jgi:hypothetical protein
MINSREAIPYGKCATLFTYRQSATLLPTGNEELPGSDTIRQMRYAVYLPAKRFAVAYRINKKE